MRFVPRVVVVVLTATSVASASVSTVPVITSYAGTGSSNSDEPLGDGGQASQTALRLPGDVEVDGLGNLYVVAGNRVRKVAPSGIISTVAGNGTQVYAGDGVLATQTGIDISGIAVDASGNLFISDSNANRVRKVSAGGIITTVAGSGPYAGFGGDGGPATQAVLSGPSGLTIGGSGGLIVSDRGNRRVRRISSNGIINTIAGNGGYESSGDGGPAVAAGLGSIEATATDSKGNLYLIDGERIRKVDAAGAITAYAGGGPFQYDPAAANVRFFSPAGLAVDALDNLYVAEAHHLVRMISPQRIVRLVAGGYSYSGLNGTPGYSGDGGPADQSLLSWPVAIAVDAQGNQFISDRLNHRVRKVSPQPPVLVPRGLDALRPYRTIPSLGWPADIVVGDVNGDGRSDVVATTSADPLQADPVNDFRLRVYLQQADGTLAAAIPFAYPAGTANAGGHLALADFNGDGVLDVAVGHGQGLSVLVGSKTSDFVLHPFHPGASAPADEAVVVADMDRDGRADVISIHTDRIDSIMYPRLTIAYGNGLGTTSRQVSVPVSPASRRTLAVGEVNGDGWLDVVDANSSTVDVLLSDAHGALLPSQLLVHEATEGVALGHLDEDYRTDLVASTSYSSDMLILTQGPGGLAVPASHRRSYPLAADTVVADFDGDQRHDVLLAHGAGAVSLFLNTSAGLQEGIKFRLPVNDVNASSGPLATGDVNGDRCSDAVLALAGIGIVVLEGHDCRVLANGSQPLVVGGTPAPMLSAQGGSLPPPPLSRPPLDQGGNRSRLVRRWIDRINLFPRVLGWLLARSGFMAPENGSAAQSRLQNADLAARPTSAPVLPAMQRHAPVLRSLPTLHLNRSACLR